MKIGLQNSITNDRFGLMSMWVDWRNGGSLGMDVCMCVPEWGFWIGTAALYVCHTTLVWLKAVCT